MLKAESGLLRTEDGGRRSEDRDRRSEVRGRRRLFGQFRNILIFIFLDENAEHIHD